MRLVAASALVWFVSLASHAASINDSPIPDADEVALELTQPIAACIENEDTSHPIFNGCIDWHSTVHATWALTAYTRIVGDDRYARFLQEYVDVDLLRDEQQDLMDFSGFEMPYGRAWFLLLAAEFDRTFDDRLIETGDMVAESLVAYYEEQPPEPFSPTYNNSAWALLNLLRYARYRDRADWSGFVEAQVRTHFLQGRCDVDKEGSGFMAICLNWAWLVSEVLDEQEFEAWNQEFAETWKTGMTPIVTPRSSHEYGMNFSRCWGLWKLYEATGDQRFLELYRAHFLATYSNRQHWRGDYRKVAHWVAQFGIHALLLPAL